MFVLNIYYMLKVYQISTHNVILICNIFIKPNVSRNYWQLWFKNYVLIQPMLVKYQTTFKFVCIPNSSTYIFFLLPAIICLMVCNWSCICKLSSPSPSISMVIDAQWTKHFSAKTREMLLSIQMRKAFSFDVPLGCTSLLKKQAMSKNFFFSFLN